MVLVGVHPGISLYEKKIKSVTETKQKQPLLDTHLGVINDVVSICCISTCYRMTVNCVTVDLDITVGLCELVAVGLWLWVVENYEPFPCRVRSAHYPVVVVLLDFVRVQEGVSRQLVLFVICGPAETQPLHAERQTACRHCGMTFNCHLGGPGLLSGREKLTTIWPNWNLHCVIVTFW